MMLKYPFLVISCHALRKIADVIYETANQWEAGGILIGYRLAGIFYVIDVSVPCGDEQKSLFSFEIDGNEETKKVNEIISQYYIKPKPIGIWHSHIGENPFFSNQDRKSNAVFAGFYGGMVSVIATTGENAALESLVAYYISPTKKEILCIIYGDYRKSLY